MRTELYLDGRFDTAASSATYVLSNPATARVVGEVADADGRDVNRAVAAAVRAFDADQDTLPGARAERLRDIAIWIRAHDEELAQLEASSSGKPITDCAAEVSYAADIFDYYAGAVAHAHGTTIPVNATGVNLTIREPFGVCALIVPWNAPLVTASQELAPALAAGNTVILKPAPATPLTALALGDAATDIGLPSGLLNVLTGSTRDLGRELVRHPGVNKISFTGSTATAHDIRSETANRIVSTTLELGGKSANVIFEDADLDQAVPSSAWAAYWNAGQDCCARSRVLVQRGIFDEVVTRFVEAAEKLRVGDPMDPGTEIGSLISTEQRRRVIAMLDRATRSGAEIVTGGEVVVGEGLEGENAVSPAVVVNASLQSELGQEEVFGPVVMVVPFDTEDDAVRSANDTRYGLAGSVWTRDGSRALRVARRLRVGQVSVNSNTSVHLEAPFGGRGASGIGRQMGEAGLEDFTELKNLYLETC